MAVGDLCYSAATGAGGALGYRPYSPDRGSLIFKRAPADTWLSLFCELAPWNASDRAAIIAAGGGSHVDDPYYYRAAPQVRVELPYLAAPVGWTYSDSQTAEWWVAKNSAPTTTFPGDPSSASSRPPVSGGYRSAVSGWCYNVAREPGYNPYFMAPWNEFLELGWTSWTMYVRLAPSWAHDYQTAPYRIRVRMRLCCQEVSPGVSAPPGGVTLNASLLGVSSSATGVVRYWDYSPGSGFYQPAGAQDPGFTVVVGADGALSLETDEEYQY